MINNKDILDDGQMKSLLKGSKLTASENLQHRIMQQILTEQALKPKKIKSAKPLIKTIMGLAIVMYILVMTIGIGAYMSGGMEALKSGMFILPMVAVSSICSVYGLVTILDERRY